MRWMRRLGSVAVVLVGLGSIASYVFASGVVNAQPSTAPFEGWVAVLQHSDQPIPEQLELRVVAMEPGAPGEHPYLRYSLLACGSRAFDGVLLIGGQARLSEVDILGPTLSDRPLVSELHDAKLVQGDVSWALGHTQVLHVKIGAFGPCVSQAGEGFAGTGYTLTGQAQAAIQHPALFLGNDTPRQSLVWPLVGGFPGVPTTNLGSFLGGQELPGDWIVPPTLHKQVGAGSVAARTTVEAVVPPLQDSSLVTWSSGHAIQPSMRVMNVDQMASAQQTLTNSGIGLGIGGSLLASLLFEWTRSRQTEVPRPRPPQQAAQRLRTGPRPSRRWRWAHVATIAGLLVLFRLLRRSRLR